MVIVGRANYTGAHTKYQGDTTRESGTPTRKLRVYISPESPKLETTCSVSITGQLHIFLGFQ